MEYHVISLPKRADRRAELLANFEELGLPAPHFYDAVNGCVKYPDYSDHMAAHFGCYDSHVQLLEHLATSGNEWECVLEDDAQLLIVPTPPDNDAAIHYLGGGLQLDRAVMELPSLPYNRAVNILCTHGYIVRVCRIAEVLDILKQRRWKIDVCMIDVQRELPCSIVKSAIAIQRPSFSDITGTHKENAHTKW